MSAQSFDPIADLRMAVEQIKREPKPQPDVVPWDEYMSRMKNRATERLERMMRQTARVWDAKTGRDELKRNCQRR